MQTNQLVFELIMNIGLMVLVASLLSKLYLVQDIILQEKRNWKSQALLSVMFGAIIILSTYTGIDIGSYSLNTRVIGAMAAGLLGGPLVGLYASMIGAALCLPLFRSPRHLPWHPLSPQCCSAFWLQACIYISREGNGSIKDLFLLACFAEVCDMVSLLRFTVPVQIGAQDHIGDLGADDSSECRRNPDFYLQLQQYFHQTGFGKQPPAAAGVRFVETVSAPAGGGTAQRGKYEELASVLLEGTDWAGVMVTYATSILEWKAKEVDYQPEDDAIPPVGKEALKTGQVAAVYQASRDSSDYEWLKNYSMIAAPFIIKEQPIGCLIVWVKKKWVLRQSEMELLQHLVTIASFQIAMAEGAPEDDAPEGRIQSAAVPGESAFPVQCAEYHIFRMQGEPGEGKRSCWSRWPAISAIIWIMKHTWFPWKRNWIM